MPQHIQENGIFLCDLSLYRDSLGEKMHSHIRFVRGGTLKYGNICIMY